MLSTSLLTRISRMGLLALLSFCKTGRANTAFNEALVARGCHRGVVLLLHSLLAAWAARA